MKASAPDQLVAYATGSNVVYHLTEPVVVRVSRGNDIERARRTVGVARWLESGALSGHSGSSHRSASRNRRAAITFWEAVSADGDEYASVDEVATVLAELHRQERPGVLAPPGACAL